MQRSTTQKFSVINREAQVIAELVTSGLEYVRKINLNQAYYYQSFFAMGMGLERLMKLIIHIEQPTVNPFKQGHNLEDLCQFLNIGFLTDSIEGDILAFLSTFAKGDRYTIVDFLYDGNSARLGKEPIVNFYKTIVIKILQQHPQKKLVFYQTLTTLDILYISRKI